MNGGHHSYSNVFICIKGVVPGTIATLTPSDFILISCFLPLLTPKFVQSSALTYSFLLKTIQTSTWYFVMVCKAIQHFPFGFQTVSQLNSNWF